MNLGLCLSLGEAELSQSCLISLLGSPVCFQTFPFFGVAPAILNESGEELEGEAEGYLVRPWPFVVSEEELGERVHEGVPYFASKFIT